MSGRELRNLFMTLNFSMCEGSNGYVSVDALQNVMIQRVPELSSKQKYEDIWADAGLEETGDVNFGGFLKWMRWELNEELHDRLIQDGCTIDTHDGKLGGFRCIFRMWDQDGGGTISTEELFEACLKTGIPERRLAQLFVAVDVNGDGELNYEEFRDFLLPIT
eukprot:CAMPEP_0197678224 /NCGR_PEP_ID=MMETSP1338-20131121/89674_1 /TAXON_ID=43686 ORGANISM="Pelagodinium beii, Strain RCC1491" /NCGR_SAMPLE_ID=MMETSP1338 /ASSEMBLY_ACC=CAM_ASM_000754 /LENGTH=162 /DNA_ID=CAMNT_0043259145 /DNA_START=57 /DNA_END=545 /DNA_ORIENTATION=+